MIVLAGFQPTADDLSAGVVVVAAAGAAAGGGADVVVVVVVTVVVVVILVLLVVSLEVAVYSKLVLPDYLRCGRG